MRLKQLIQRFKPYSQLLRFEPHAVIVAIWGVAVAEMLSFAIFVRLGFSFVDNIAVFVWLLGARFVVPQS